MSKPLCCPKCGHVGNAGDVYCPRDASLLVTPDPLVGTLLDNRYEILAKLGEGGMGVVYKARNKHVPERACAIKVVRQEFAKSADYKKRFLREAQALIRARHRHIVEAYDVHETVDGVLFLVMEFLSGQTIESAIHQQQTRSLPLSQALYIVDQVAESLHHAHTLKIIHRDIKPGNIFVISEAGDPNFVKMVDFGLARLLDQAALTLAAQVMGTPGYMAPEIFLGGDYLSPALDVYALGCTLFEMLTGSLPFDFNDFEAMRDAHIKLLPPRLTEKRPGTNYPPELERLVKEMLAKQRDERPKLPDLRKTIQGLRARLPRRTVQSMMLAATAPHVHATLQDPGAQLEPDARDDKVRRFEGQLAVIEQLELERVKVGNELDDTVDKILKIIHLQMTLELKNLRAEWVENRLRDLRVQEELEDVQMKQQQDEQSMMRRKAELHLVIDKVRSDIRKRPPRNTVEAEQDERALADLERAYFGVQLAPPEGVAQLLKKQQQIRHNYFLSLYKLGMALAAHIRGLGKKRTKVLKPSDFQDLERSLEHLGRCNQNVEVLVADLPAEVL